MTRDRHCRGSPAERPRAAWAWARRRQTPIVLLVVAALACAGLAGSALGQAAAEDAGRADEAFMVMNRALIAYNEGQVESYRTVVELLTGLLEQSPGYAPALFLRALAHGELAVAGDRAAEAARAATQPAEMSAARQAAGEHYRLMARDIDALWVSLGREVAEDYAIARLVEGVVLAKVAGFEPRAADVERLLDRSRRALEMYLQPAAGSGLPEPAGLNRVRAEYFLGVIIYRQSLRWPATAGQAQALKDRARLDVAGEIMSRLENVERVLEMLRGERNPQAEARRWASYANLYLGLIRTRQANDDYLSGRSKDEVKATYQQALSFLSAAQDLDRDPRTSTSRSNLIPQLVEGQSREIQKTIEELDVSAPRFTEDFRLEWRSGLAYDTNVTLLGDDTSTPRDIGRKADWRFSTDLNLSYRLDLGKVDPGLDRWTVGFFGRAASVWNADIHDYNEQDYSGSAAILYEAMRQRDTGRKHGPLYLGIQYDYDYFLLGNDGFVRMNRVQPRATLYTFNRRLESSLGLRYEDRNYLEPLYSNVFDRDGNYFGLNVTQTFDLVDMTEFYACRNIEPWGLANDPTEGYPAETRLDAYRRWLQVYVGFEYGWDSTRGSEFDQKREALMAGMELPLPYGVLLNLGGEWEWQDYQGFKGGSLIDYHRRGREDFIQRYSLGLQRRFVLVPGQPVNRRQIQMDRVVMTLRGSIQFTDDDSNVEDRLGQAIFSYDRAMYGLSVAFEFN